MDNTPHLTYEMSIDQSEAGLLRLTLYVSGEGEVRDLLEVAYHGPVDNILLTSVDKLLQRSNIHRSALVSVTQGPGIDKNSSLGRIVTSFASAITAARTSPR